VDFRRRKYALVDTKFHVSRCLASCQLAKAAQQEYEMEACGGWPRFPPFALPFRNRGCPVLAFFARAGGDAACTT
jgi:hypothetical protein